MKKIIASVTIAGATLGLGTATALAGTDSGDSATTKTANDRGDGGRRLLRASLQVAADTIGVSAEELRQAVDGGQTIAQVAQQHGVDPQQAVDAVVQAATTKLDEAVAAGTIPAARADALKAKLPERATRLVNETGQHRGERTERRARRQAVIDAAAKELGVSSEQLRDALQAGRAAAGQS